MDNTSIALLGLPNSGKSSLFNSLCGTNQKVANFPGVTIEKKEGRYNYNGKSVTVVDLPGLYTLDAQGLEEKVTRDFIFHRSEEKIGTYLLVLDATNLKKSLYLALQLKELNLKYVVALNMSDISSKRGQKLDILKLQNHLGAPVIESIAVTDQGVEELRKIVDSTNTQNDKFVNNPEYQKQIKSPEYIKLKLNEVDRILKEITLESIKSDTLTEKIDGLLLHPVWGVLILFSTLIGMFQVLFIGADPFMGWIEAGFEWGSLSLSSILPEGLFRDLVIDGIIAGVGGVLVFVPHIFFLYIMILFLEDVGYLGRAAFLLDYVMRKVGLPGRAVVPLLSSHACAVPGIMAARIISNPRQRLITMMIAPLTTCSARLPVYTLLIAAIVPDQKVFGFLSLDGLAMSGMYLFGIISAFAVAFITKKTAPKTSPAYLMMEMPGYRIPQISSILVQAFNKVKIFIKKAGTVILGLSIVIWFLVTFPQAPENADRPAIEYSAAAMIGKTIEPAFRPLGFDWKITTALIPSFGAREVLVSAMGTVMAVDGDEEDEAYTMGLKEKLTNEYHLGTLLALLMWFVFAPQCVATYGILKKETNGHKMPLIYMGYTLILSYVFSAITYAMTVLVVG